MSKFSSTTKYVSATPRSQRRKQSVAAASSTTSTGGSVLAGLVDLISAQGITGVKDFLNGLRIGGAPITYDATTQSFFFEGNIVLSGGVAMRAALGALDVPTIMDALVVDDSNLKVIDGVLTFVGQTGGGGIDEDTLSKYLTDNRYTTQDWVLSQRYLTGISSSMVTDALGYTPLSTSGGEIKADIASPLAISNANSEAIESGLEFKLSTFSKGWVGYNKSHGTILYTYTGSHYLGIKDNGVGHIDDNTILHSGNYSDYALPKSGGTISNSSFTPLEVKRDSTTGVGMKFSNNNKTLGSIGFVAGDNPYPIWSDINGNNFTLIHSGNYSEYFTKSNIKSTLGISDWALESTKPTYTASEVNAFYESPYVQSGSLNDVSMAGIYRFNDISDGHVGATSYGNLMVVRSHNNDTLTQIYFNYNDGSHFFIRSGTPTTYSTNPWKQIAFTDSNVASATKLQTPRTIWGQSFDGTGNITGALTLSDSDQINGTKEGIAINFNAGKEVPTSIYDGIYGIIARFGADGNVSIGGTTADEKLHIHGNILATGDITMRYTSDMRLKRNRESINASEILMSLGEVQSFEYVDSEVAKNHRYAGRHIGLMYQNVVGTALDRMCHEREDGYGSLNYIDTSYLALLGGVGREHEVRIRELERENRDLKEKIYKLERII